jgi:DNA-directed RNA polymerase specialized sigma24 family protein
MIYGPAGHIRDDKRRPVALVPRTRPVDFARVESLVRWWLNAGRDAVGQLRAFDPSRERTGRDLNALTRLHAKFADVVRCTRDLTPAQVELLTLAYREGRSDLQISERAGCSRRAIADQRRAALRVVQAHAEAIGLMSEEH